jgi:uncharacterized protein involved in exopolysaccharide biosynthesis
MLLESESWRPQTKPSSARTVLVPLDLLSSICRDIRRIVVAMVVTLAAGLTVAAVLPPRYIANASLLVLLSPDYGPRSVAGMPDNGGGGMLDRDAFLRSELEILTSPSLQTAAMDSIGAAKLYPRLFAPPSILRRIKQALFGRHDPHATAARYFEDSFAATADKTGNFLSLSFHDADPVLAAASVNAVIGQYLQRRQALYRDAQSTSLSSQADTLRTQLEGADQALADFKARSGIINYDTQRDLLLKQRDDLTRDLQSEDSAAAQAQQSQSAAAAQLAGTSQSVVISDEVDTRRAAELARVGATATGATVRRGRSTVYEALDLDRKRAAVSLQAARARQERDVQQLTAVQNALARLETDEVELDRLARARGLLAQNYQAVSKALGERQLVEAVESNKESNVRVIQAAEPPDRPTNARLVIAAASVLLSLFAGVAVALLSHLFRSGYISPETLEQRLGVPVLASIPDLTKLDRSYDRLSDYGPAG